jgi:hypothetical protein
VIITVDPNVRGCGVSGFLKGILQWAVYVKNPLAGTRQYAVDVSMAEALKAAVSDRSPFMPDLVIIERPRVYPGMPQTDLNDLIDVACVGAACATYFSKVQTVFPSEWKGQVPKKTMLARIASKLTEAETLVVQKTNKSDTEDILDSVGIGLWNFGRLNINKYPGAEP